MPIKQNIGRHPRRLQLLLVAAICALLISPMVGDAQSATSSSPTLTLNPAGGGRGAVTQAQASTSTNGAFNVSVTIPKTATLGNHTLAATAAGATTKTTVHVVPLKPTPSPTSTRVGTSYASTVLADKPIDYWRLNESSGTTAADATSKQPGTYSNVTLGQSGLVSGGDTATAFNGSTSIVTVGTLGGAVTDFSIEGWQKLDSSVTSGNHPVIAGNGVRFMGRAGNGGSGYYAGVTLGGTEYVLQDSISQDNAGAVVHWVMVRQGATLTVYRDGVAVESRSDLPSTATASVDGNLGGATDAYYSFGELGEVAVYSAALSARRIQAHYTAGTSNTVLPPTPTPTQVLTPTPTPTQPPPTPTARPTLASTAIPAQTPAGTVYWSGDFSSADFSQWAGVQAGTILNQGTAWGASDPAVQGNTVASVVSSPTRHGGYAASLVDNDTTGSGASHDSASVVNSVAQTHASAGEDTYYGWSVYFPISNKGNWAGPQASWNLFWEWISGGAHYWGQPGGFGINTVGWADDPTGNTNPRIFAAFNVGNDGSYTDPSPYSWVDNTYPFQYDQWIDFVVHIKWTTADLSDRSGAFEIWKNGAKVYSVNGIHTLPNVVENNTAIEIMNYRQTWTRTTTHYIDQVRVGSNYGAVDPSVIR
jgi:hypothetical protein